MNPQAKTSEYVTRKATEPTGAPLRAFLRDEARTPKASYEPRAKDVRWIGPRTPSR